MQLCSQLSEIRTTRYYIAQLLRCILSSFVVRLVADKSYVTEIFASSFMYQPSIFDLNIEVENTTWYFDSQFYTDTW